MRHDAGSSQTGRLALYRAGEFICTNLARLLLVPILLILFAAVLSQFTDAKSHSLIRQLLSAEARIEQPLITTIRSAVPTRFRGRDIARWIVVLLVYFLSVGVGWAGGQCSVQAAMLREQRRKTEEDSLGQISSGMGREKLLEIYTQAKKTLDEHKRSLAFLSIDVVDSTGLKRDEDPGVAERDFKQYKRLIEKVLQARRALKSAWTPDGVMICFSETQAAVDAAADVLEALLEFNRGVKAIKRDFSVRIGINAGEVLYDEDTPMEEMSDRTIDIAGHFQKHGSVNAISLPKPIAASLGVGRSFKPTGRRVDDLEVYEWTPAAKTA